MRAALVLAALLSAGPLAAQESAAPGSNVVSDPSVDGVTLARCLDDADAPERCIGAVSAPCVETAGGVAEAVAACHGREQTAWQVRLDAVVARLRDDAAAADAVADLSGAPTAEVSTSQTPMPGAQAPALPRKTLLDRAQSAWIAWRDAECAWHAGGFDPQAAAAALAECGMSLTARRAMTLEPQGRAVDGP